jgi:guanylate kinase
MRDYETDGEHYHFVNRQDFQRLIDGGQLLEWAEFAGNLYGTPRAQVEGWLGQGRPVLLKIDLQGARQVRATMPDAQLVFLAPPSVEELKRRLVGRGTDDEAQRERRLATAKEELAAQDEFDEVVVNTDLRTTAEQLLKLMLDNSSSHQLENHE